MGTYLLAVAAAAMLAWFLVKPYVKRGFDVAAFVKKNLRKLGAYALLGVAALLSLKGRFDIGIFVAGIGAWMLGHDSLAGLVQRAVGAPAQRARVRARIVEVEIDPQSGITGGMVLAGALAGRALDSLSEAELKSFLAQAAESDPDALGLLEPYLDRRLAGWRETFDADLYRRRADAAQRGAQAGVMASQEAQQILGLQPGAAREEVVAAHRALIQKFHPDKGGTAYLAAKLNEARDVLLGR